MAKIINIHTGDESVHEAPTPEVECTICKSLFDLDGEGGTTGLIGMLWVTFCPYCLSGILDMAQQLLGIDDGEEKEEE